MGRERVLPALSLYTPSEQTGDGVHHGYIKYHRKIQTSEIWQLRVYDVSKLWDWILLNANWADNPELGLQAGQLSFSLRFIANAMESKDGRGKVSKPTVKTIRRHLQWLEERKMIQINADVNEVTDRVRGRPHPQTVISVCNWETYQSSESEVDYNNDHNNDYNNDHKPKKLKKYKKREGEDAREVNVTIHTEPLKPIDLSDEQLLPALPDFDAQQIIEDYALLCQKHRRAAEPIIKQVVNALHRDPTAERQLSSEEIKTIISEQVVSGYPLKLAQLWNANPRQGNLPFWESNLLMAQRRRSKPNHGESNAKRTKRDINAELAESQEFDNKLRERGWTLVDYYKSGEKF